jgi:hypothetical protein
MPIVQRGAGESKGLIEYEVTGPPLLDGVLLAIVCPLVYRRFCRGTKIQLMLSWHSTVNRIFHDDLL